MHERIRHALSLLQTAQANYTRIIEEVQEACDHPLVNCVETSSTRESWTVGCGYGTASSGTPPYKLCRECGYAECQWRPPNPRRILHQNLPEMPQGQADKLRVGTIHARD